MTQGTRTRESSAQRGYGAAHQRARTEHIARHQPDDPCARCGEALGDDVSKLDLDHNEDRTGYLGLSHQTCNRTYGRRQVPRGRNQRAKRTCVRCFATYQPTHSDQRYCGRMCAGLARRVIRPPREPVTYQKRCVTCAAEFTAAAATAKYCPAHRGYQPRVSARPCEVCGQAMSCRQGPRRYCSIACRRLTPTYRATRRRMKQAARERKQRGRGGSDL